MNRRAGRWIAVAGTVALAAVSACGSSSKHSSSGGTSAGGSSASSGASGNTASDVGITPATITVGYITSVTGVASSSFADAAAGARARIDLQNAQGGVDGRKLQLVVADDQSAPAQDATAAQNLIENKKVFGVIDSSSFAFGGARYLQQQGIPVTGAEFDGPEWGQQPYSNMFSFLPPLFTPYNGSYYAYSYWGTFAHQVGITKTAGFAYGISPSSVNAVKGILTTTTAAGIKNCYSNLSVPFGGVDFTASVLAMKSAGCDGAFTALVDSSDVALAQAVKNGGINAKVIVGGTAYDQAVLQNPAAKQALEGDYMGSTLFFDPSIPAMGTMLNALKQYVPNYVAGSIPDYGLWESYLSADLMIKGLEVAGQNPTRQSFIKNLRSVSSYDAGGILPSPIGFTHFGTADMVPQTNCEYFLQLKSGQYVNASPDGKAVCGTRVKFTP